MLESCHTQVSRSGHWPMSTCVAHVYSVLSYVSTLGIAEAGRGIRVVTLSYLGLPFSHRSSRTRAVDESNMIVFAFAESSAVRRCLFVICQFNLCA